MRRATMPDARHESENRGDEDRDRLAARLSVAPIVVIAPLEDGQPAVNNRPILLSSFAAGRAASKVASLISHLPCARVGCRRLLMKASLHTGGRAQKDVSLT